ncbi:type II secretion system F family protein, partial [Fibrobacterota bacterium]
RRTVSHLMKGVGQLFAPADVAHFTSQLAGLLHAGVPLIESLEQAGASTSRSLKKNINQVISDILTGYSLADSLAKYPASFSKVYTSAIYSLDRNGKLDDVLKHLSVFLQKVLALRLIRNGLWKIPMYLVLFLLAFCSVSLLVIAPFFSAVYQKLEVVVPFPTRVIINASLLPQKYPVPVIILFALPVVLFCLVRFFKPAQTFFQAMVLRVPVTGHLIRTYTLAVFCRVTAFLLGRGIPLPQALQNASSEIDNQVYKEMINMLSTSASLGKGLSKSLGETGGFPELLCRLITMGEQHNNLVKRLDEAGTFYAEEFITSAARVKTMSSAFAWSVALGSPAVAAFLFCLPLIP